RRRYETAEREKSDCDNRILFLTRELQEGEQKQTQVRFEQTTLARQIQAADERIAKLEDELAAEHATLGANQGQQEVLEAAQDDVAKREDEATEQLKELRLPVPTERQRYDHLIAQRRPMSTREAELAEAIATRQAEILNFEKRLTTQSERARAALTEQRRERSTTMNKAESNLRTIRNSLNDLRDSRSKEQVRQAELQLKIDNLTDRVSRRYQINLPEFSSDQFAFEKTLRAQLKRRIDRSVGDVTNGSE